MVWLIFLRINFRHLFGFDSFIAWIIETLVEETVKFFNDFRNCYQGGDIILEVS